MEEGNSNWSGNRNGFGQRTPFLVNMPQEASRNPDSMTLDLVQEGTLSLRNNLSNVFVRLGPLMHHARSAETHGMSIRSWLQRSIHTDPIVRPSTADNVAVQFNNSSGPSSSNMEQPYCLNHNIPARMEGNSLTLSHSECDRGNHPIVNQISEDSNVANNHSPITNENTSISIPIPASQSNEGTQADHRNSTSSFDKVLNNCIPFLSFLVMKAIYDHRTGVLIFVGLLVTFTHANSVLKREIAKQSRRSLLSLGILFVNLFVCISLIYFVFRDQKLYRNLIFNPYYSEPFNVWDLLWMVGITDFIIRLITIQLKVGMACIPGKLLPYSARGKWYLMLESTSQLYRGLVPIQPWIHYLMEMYQGSENAIGMFFSVAYVVSKASDLTSKTKLFMAAFWKLLQNSRLGVRPSIEQLETAGSQCPICHDEYNSPVVLNCQHVFCDACVTTWFDREPTCPLCRAKVADDPSWRDGATSFFIQLF